MDKIEISIGRDTTNDIVYNNMPVSLFHCKAEISSRSKILLIDNSSGNGTWVNGVRIVRKYITLRDKISLGSVTLNSEDLFSQLYTIFDAKRVDYSAEYEKVLHEYKKYQDSKDKILDPPRIWYFIRLIVGVVFILVLVFFKNLIPDPDTRYILISIVGLLSVFAALFNTPQSKKNELLDKLRLDYEDLLVCPKCKASLMGHGYTYWTAKTRCIRPGCDAKYARVS